jgi:hypothetical protein
VFRLVEVLRVERVVTGEGLTQLLGSERRVHDSGADASSLPRGA